MTGPHALILRKIARMEPLAETLRAIVIAVRQAIPSAKAAILLAKEQKLSRTVAAGFTKKELRALDGLSLPGPACELSSPHPGLRTIHSGLGEILAALWLDADDCGEASLVLSPEEETGLTSLEDLAALAIEQSHLVDELNYCACHDSLTQLLDRLSTEQKLAEALAGSSLSGHEVALIVLDIDRLHHFNTNLGHRIGNLILREVAQRIEGALAADSVAGRAGGDEFFILLPRAGPFDEVRFFAEQLTALLRQPFFIEDNELRLTASAGVSISAAGDFRPDDLEARAYAALDHAKLAGGNQVSLFDCSMLSVSPGYLDLETRLRGALAGNELLLHYQPQVSMADLSIVGVEALLRWQHHDLGLVSPCAFIPIAEQGGLITGIGEWALTEAIRQHARFRQSGLGALRLGVNISPVQFRRPDFVRRILALLEHSDIDPRLLLLEITEGAVMLDLETAVSQMNRLRETGIRFALDDFGTGYSALSCLQKIPVSQIKIDRSFVQEIRYSGQQPVLLSNILRLAADLGIPTIAEGIETAEQAEALSAMGCQEGQGFLYSKPITAEELEVWSADPAKARQARDRPSPLPPHPLTPGVPSPPGRLPSRR